MAETIEIIPEEIESAFDENGTAAEHENKEQVKTPENPEGILSSQVYDAFAEALIYELKWPQYLLEGSDAVLTQQEVLAAWLMGIEKIGGDSHDLNPDVLATNAHTGGIERKTADELVDSLHEITDNAMTNAWEDSVDPVIEEAELQLRLLYGKEAGSEEHKELMRLNAAKKAYDLTFPKSTVN